MIETRELRKIFPGGRGLAGYTLAVQPGALMGLVGPNGAGKTTLIKILATLLSPDGGIARVGGQDVVTQPYAVRAVMGYMPDVPGVYQDMTVREFLEFFAEAFHLHGHAKQEAVQRALALSGLTGREDSYVEELSLGWKQRLVLGRTLLHAPKVLLLDEPATGLDPLARIELREELKTLHQQGITILISSHILSDLEDICTDIAFIQEGRNVGMPGPAAAAQQGLRCLVEIVGDVAAARSAAAAFPGASVGEAQRQRLIVSVASGEQAPALLKHLVDAGVQVMRFEPQVSDLEQRYRDTFGRRA